LYESENDMQPSHLSDAYADIGREGVIELGGSVNDFLDGCTDDDSLHGGMGSDYLYGGVGRDDLYGEAGDDALYGGLGRDDLRGGAGDDALYGGMGRDDLHGGTGDDTLRGGMGNDLLYGGMGNDYLYGGAGNDIYLFKRNDGVDHLDESRYTLDWATVDRELLQAKHALLEERFADKAVMSESGDKLQFGDDISYQHLWFQRNHSNDLVVSLLASHDRVIIKGWFLQPSVEYIDTYDSCLEVHQVLQLVAVMAQQPSPEAQQQQWSEQQAQQWLPLLGFGA